MPLDTAWLYSVAILLMALGALFILAALLDARSRSRRLRRFTTMTFRPIPRNLLLKMRGEN
jgi:hypothetical protein